MSRYIVVPSAAADLFEIWLRIAGDSEETADRVIGEFYDTFETLARMPGMGHRRPDYTKARVLFFPHYSYLIVYQPGTDPLPIVAVVHGGRNVRKILKRRNI